MDLLDIKRRIEKNRIPDELYYIGEGYPNEAYCIYEEDGIFVVYYSERGRRVGEKRFANGSEACEYVLPKLVRYAEGCKRQAKRIRESED